MGALGLALGGCLCRTSLCRSCIRGVEVEVEFLLRGRSCISRYVALEAAVGTGTLRVDEIVPTTVCLYTCMLDEFQGVHGEMDGLW